MTRSRSSQGAISWRGWGPVSAPRSLLPRISRGGMDSSWSAERETRGGEVSVVSRMNTLYGAERKFMNACSIFFKLICAFLCAKELIK